MDKCFDGINSAKDTTNDTQEKSQGTESKFIPRLVTNTSQFKITQDRQKEDEATVRESTNETHEIIKVRDEDG